jgi:hypothetical protein
MRGERCREGARDPAVAFPQRSTLTAGHEITQARLSVRAGRAYDPPCPWIPGAFIAPAHFSV